MSMKNFTKREMRKFDKLFDALYIHKPNFLKGEDLWLEVTLGVQMWILGHDKRFASEYNKQVIKGVKLRKKSKQEERTMR